MFVVVCGDMNSSYQVIEERGSREVGGKIKILQHKSGARIISVENKDKNKVFAIGFGTPVDNSTGVAHILEHMVLNGSKKYPTKEPFVDLIKTSLKTFLNAFTFPDKTVYPVASENEKDFYNLVDVYLDAVFNPLLLPQVFMQEGWRYAHGEDKGWHYAGVVFNEMKGSLSSADRVFGRLIEEGVLADTHYKYESGGDPEEIVNLSHKELVSFHKKHYRPDNAWILFWGDDPWEKRERILNQYLLDQDFHRSSESMSELQAKFGHPVIKRGKYVFSGDDGEMRNLEGVYWLGDEIINYGQLLEAMVVNHVLLGNPGSPVKKALIESGLGSSLLSEGLDSEHKAWIWGVGMRDVKEADLGKVEKLVLETLARLSASPIEQDLIDGAINSLEFALREDDSGAWPRGLEIFLRAMNLWLHGHSPVDVLAWSEAWNKVKAKFSDETEVRNWIGKYLIDNSHRVRVELVADVNLGAKQEADEKARLDKQVGIWSAEEIVEQQAKLSRLREWQVTPDSKEALAKLPKLSLADVDPEVVKIPIEVSESDYVQLWHELPTTGIGYVNLAFDITNLNENDGKWVALWADLLDELGTKREDFVKFSNRIDRSTGGIEVKLLSSANFDGQAKAYVILRGKALDQKPEELMKIFGEIMFNLDWNKKDRVRQVVLESIAGMESELLDGGHSVIRSRLAAKLTTEGRRSEEWNGVEQLMFLRKVLGKIDDNWDEVKSNLEKIGSQVWHKQGLIVDYTSTGEQKASWQKSLTSLVNKLRNEAAGNPGKLELLSPTLEVLTMETPVNYVGLASRVGDIERKGAFSAVVAHVGTSYLWEKVRMSGGAYGAMLSYEPVRGIVYGVSYRDPKLVETWEVYGKIGEFLQTVKLAEEEIEQLAIGLLAEVPQSVGYKGYLALVRYITGWSDERRQQWRDEIMSLNLEDFHQGGVTLAGLKETVRGVLTSPRLVGKIKDAYGEVKVLKLM